MEENNQLSIQKIFGTSAKSPSHFTASQNHIAYTASGGVVVCQLDKEDLSKIKSQKFYVANTVPVTYSQPTYLPNDSLPQETKKDAFGFPINSEPTVIGTPTQSGILNSGILAGTSEIDLSSSFSKMKDRIRTINCISICPNERILAVGECGYQPRILLYSLAPDASSSPIALIYEHLFGINLLSFSRDSKYLCSLGVTNDGFLNVWKIGFNVGANGISSVSVTLAGTNKCSSLINQVIWHEDYIITLGLRILKIWKLDHNELNQPKAYLIKGKNVLLGKFMSSNFINGDILNNDEVIIVTDQNELLLLKLNYDKLTLNNLTCPDYNFNSLLIDHEKEKLWLGSTEIKSIPLSSLKPTNSPLKPTAASISPTNSPKTLSILKLSHLTNDTLVYLSSTEEIITYNKETDQANVLISALMKNIAGIKLCHNKKLVLFSKNGSLKCIKDEHLEEIIDFDLPSNELVENYLTAIDCNDEEIILGDKYGSLYVLDAKTSKVVFMSKAHESTINELNYSEIGDKKFILSISRDRMIQVFYRDGDQGSWDILQTIPTHRGNLLKLVWFKDRIYVCSSDRTISIHYVDVSEGVTIYQEKIISLKNAPISMKIFDKELIVATNDKNLSIYNIDKNYESVRYLKLYNENNESLLIEHFYVQNKLVYVSSNDKSLRVFNYSTGKLLGTNWGHSDSIFGLLMNDNQKLISVGNDGCLFTWEFKDPKTTPQQTLTDCTNTINTPLYAKVTRKIIPTTPITPITKKDALPRVPVIPASRTQTRSPLHRVQSTSNLASVTNSSTASTPNHKTMVNTTSARSVSPVTKAKPIPSTAAKARLNATSRLKSRKSTNDIRSTTDIRSKLSQCVDVKSNFIPSCNKCGHTVDVPSSSATTADGNGGDSTANMTSNVLTLMKNFRQSLANGDTYSQFEKQSIKEELGKVMELIDGGREAKLLESYSERLIELFRRKLSVDDSFSGNDSLDDTDAEVGNLTVNDENECDVVGNVGVENVLEKVGVDIDVERKLELVESNLTKLAI